MTILGIETSCDETSAAVITVDTKTNQITVLSNTIASSLSLHATTGGIIPEVAAREQMKYILPVLHEALSPLSSTLAEGLSKVDAIAVTYGPGLIGSLLVGVETARSLAMLSNKPLIPVNHLYGHIYANWIGQQSVNSNQQSAKSERPYAIRHSPFAIAFPALALVVSGGHTDLVLLKSHSEVTVIGGTRDDAAGEAFDKIGRLLNFPYPAGPTISKLAQTGNPKAYPLPRPMWASQDFDFSFSGLKTAALREVKSKTEWSDQEIADMCASVEQTIVAVLVHKTIQAAKHYNVKSILLGGGVAANQTLRTQLERSVRSALPNAKLFIAQKSFCTDNAAMIAAAAYFHGTPQDWRDVTADPQLYY